LNEEKAEIVGVTMNSSPCFSFGKRLVEEVKRRRRDVIFVAGGHHATFLYPEILRNGFDYVVLGEGEETFTDLVNTLQVQGDISKVKGISYIEEDKIVRNPPRPYVEKLDALPLPAFDLLEKELYKADILESGAYISTMETARGCPYNCEYCSVTAMWGHRWRFKSVERILTELEILKSLGYKWIFIVDDNFIIPEILEERKRLFQEVRRRNLDSLNWIVQMRADIVVKMPSLIGMAAKAGLRIAFIGIESGSNEVLRRMRKGISTKIISKAIRILHKNGVLVFGGFMIGAPYEDKKQIDISIKYAKQLTRKGLDAAQFTIYTPFQGQDHFINLC